MTRLIAAAAIAALSAGPALAGDQPVIFPTMPPVFEKGGTDVYYYYKFDTIGVATTTSVGPTGLSGTATGGTAATAPARAAQGVVPDALPSGAAGNALYAALLEEARSRGLR